MRFGVLLASLVLAAPLFWVAMRLPPPAPASAPAAEFSAARAMADVSVIGQTPHPVGSPRNREVRDYLVQRLTAMGLKVRVQPAVGVDIDLRGDAPLVQGANVENIVAILPGQTTGEPALALMAHYDSVWNSPGAADDAVGVAAVLETVRAIKARGTPERDIVVILTDGEEAGLLGAHAFFESDELAPRIGFVINVDVRGSGGRPFMFQTGEKPAGAVALFARAAPMPRALSAAAMFFTLAPNDTDFTPAVANHLQGFNISFARGEFDYHSPTATAANVDRGALQLIGGQALALTQAVAFAKGLPAQGAGPIYADVLGLGVAGYPVWAGWIVLGLIALALLIAIAGEAKRARIDAWGLARGAGAGLYVLLTSAAILNLLRRCAASELGRRALTPHFEVFEIILGLGVLAVILIAIAASERGRSWMVMGALALGLGAAASAFGGLDLAGLGIGAAAVLAAASFRHPTPPAAGWAGLMLLALGAGLVLQILAPQATLLVTWPLAAAAVMAQVSRLGEDGKAPRAVAVIVIGAISLAWIAVLFDLALVSLDLPAVGAIAAFPAALILWPAVRWAGAIAARKAGAALLLVSLAGALAMQIINPWSPRFPRPSGILHVTEGATGQTWRMALVAPDDWMRAALTADGGTLTTRTFPALLAQNRPAARAQPIRTPPPPVSFGYDVDGRLVLRALPVAGADRLILQIKVDAPIEGPEVGGRRAPILSEPGEWTSIFWQGSEKGVAVSFHPRGEGTITVRYASLSRDWPLDARPLPPMPPDRMASGLAGASAVVTERSFRW